MDRLDRLQRALNFAGDTHALEHVARAVKDGEANWWQGDRSDIITEFYEYPLSGRACRVWLASGDMAECLRMYDDIEDWARANNAERMEIVGRPGWRRVMAGRGFTEAGVALRKGLRDE
jgi:predicted Fe-S protein YdhL (DUF1289 family)